MSGPDNALVIAAVHRWQTHPFFQPLTCGADSSHRNLEPVEMNGQVILACADCAYRQSDIPDVVVKFIGPKPAVVEVLNPAAERRMA